MNRRVIIFSIAISFIAVAAVLAVWAFAPKNQQQNEPQKLNVVASANFWGNIAAQIGGDQVDVTSIITDPDVDPHLYESSAQDAGRVAQADIVIINGGHYDEFMESLVDASPKEGRIVVNAAETMGVGHDGDPHMWYDIPKINLVANAIEAALSQKRPEQQRAFTERLSGFTGALGSLLNQIEAIRTAHPDAPVAYTERVAGYLLHAAGLSVKTPAGFAAAIEEGNEPDPASQLAFESLITQKQIRVLIYNSQAQSQVTEHLRALAQQNGIPVVNFTETMPKNATDYQTWQQSQIDALQKALDNTR